MLSTSQKAVILSKAGVAVPPFPARRMPVQERFLQEDVSVPRAEVEADEEQRRAAQEWTAEVNNLYAGYVAARAAKSLREAEEAEALVRLRNANTSGGRRA
jgi:hypothetical protein